MKLPVMLSCALLGVALHVGAHAAPDANHYLGQGLAESSVPASGALQGAQSAARDAVDPGLALAVDLPAPVELRKLVLLASRYVPEYRFQRAAGGPIYDMVELLRQTEGLIAAASRHAEDAELLATLSARRQDLRALQAGAAAGNTRSGRLLNELALRFKGSEYLQQAVSVAKYRLIVRGMLAKEAMATGNKGAGIHQFPQAFAVLSASGLMEARKDVGNLLVADAWAPFNSLMRRLMDEMAAAEMEKERRVQQCLRDNANEIAVYDAEQYKPQRERQNVADPRPACVQLGY
jgi:hypothetical protein